MAPNVKYSKYRIVEMGLKLVRKNGIESVSARAIAKELGCSICPIFSCFETMEELKKDLLKEIYKIYEEYIDEGIKNSDKPFKGSGLAYIKFAKENKNYFKALFMGSDGIKMDDVIENEDNKKINNLICECSGFDSNKAYKLHKYNWIFVHGVAVMIATDYCNFSDEEISLMLSDEYLALLNKFKGENDCE